MSELILKRGRERSLVRRHPWIFSGAISEIKGQPQPGDTIEVLGHQGQWLARAGYSPSSQIAARVWTWDEGEQVDKGFFARSLDRAMRSRERLVSSRGLVAYREVHAESDGLPGIIVDRYQALRVIQLLAAGAERWKEAIIEALAARGDCAGIYERSDTSVRSLEGLAPRCGVLWGRPPDPAETIDEYGIRFLVDVVGGQKTGHYLDQRENRLDVRPFVSGAEVLDCFAYTGGFTLAGLSAGAGHVLAIDSSSTALDRAKENVVLNGFAVARCDWVVGDVFTELRALSDRGKRFDAIVLDPPRFAPTSAQAQKAARGYKDINRLAFKLLNPGGILCTFSCSGGISAELFQKIVADAALDAEVRASVVGWLGQPADHPVSLAFPEGRYLKGLICRV